MRSLVPCIMVILCSHVLQAQVIPCRPSGFDSKTLLDTTARPLPYDTSRSVQLYLTFWDDCSFRILYDSTNQLYLYTIENRSKSNWLLVGTKVIINQFEGKIGIALGDCCQTIDGCYLLSLMRKTWRRQIAPQTTFIGRIIFTRDKLIAGRPSDCACLLISRIGRKPFPDKHNFCDDAVEDYPDIKQEQQVMTVRMMQTSDFDMFLAK